MANWREDLVKARDALTAVVADKMPDATENTLPPILSELDAQCRPLRDWLRDRNADCSNWLKDEAETLAGLADRLWERAQVQGD